MSDPEPQAQSRVPFARLWRWWQREWQKTRERWRRYAVRSLLVLLVLLVVRGVANLWIGHEVNGEIAALEKTYGSMSVRSLAPPRMPQAENRARVVRAAASLVVFDNQLGTLDWYSRLSSQPSPELAEKMEQLLRANQLAVHVAEQARVRPKSNWQIEYAYDDGNFPPLLDVRTLGTVLAVSCRADLQAGRVDQAADAALAGLAAAGSFRQEPNTLIQLIRIAIANEQFKCLRDLMERAEPSAPLLSELASMLAAGRAPDPMRTALVGELKVGNAKFARMEYGEPTGMGGPTSASIAWIVRPLIRYGRLRYLRGIAEVLEWQAIPPHGRASSGGRWPVPSPGEPRPKWWQFLRRFDETFSGRAGLMRAAESGYEHESVLNAVELAVALRRFRLDRGAYPDSLAALAPQYVARVPIDPFTGRPPEYTRQGAGFELRAHRARQISSGSADERLYEWKIPR